MGLRVAEESLQRMRAMAAMLGATLCWSSGSVMTKALVGETSPQQLLFFQLLGSTTVLWLVVAALGVRLPCRKELGRIGALGILEPGLAYLCSTLGLQYTSASVSSLIFATEPAMVAVFAWVILRERMSARLASSLALSLFGVSLTISHGGTAQLLGAGLITLSTLLAALYVVLNQRLVRLASPLVCAATQQSVGAIFSSAIFLAFLPGAALPTINQLPLILLSGVVQYGCAFWLYLVAVRTLPVTIATIFLCCTPVFTIVGGGICLGETLSVTQWLGSMIVVGALGVGAGSPTARNIHL